MHPIVRFAPSPTGFLHVGNIRAALFNWLFARKQGGTFILRLDDTDTARSTADYANAIQEDLRWLGLQWDTMFRQSTRLSHYNDVLQTLIKHELVYPCFETPEELSLKRRTQRARGLPPVYDRAALRLSTQEKRALEDQGRRPHWRFRLPEATLGWVDAIQGEKHIPASSLSDPVVVREDGVPLYTFCSVVDDHDYGVTHIIRGEDHVTNTVVQLALWHALTPDPPPVFGHYPMLVMASGEAMSKRLGTLSIRALREDSGLEAMAINALLARLGTAHAVIPVHGLNDLIEGFDLADISRATPRFDEEMLAALNAKWLHGAALADVAPSLAALGLPEVTEDFWRAIAPNLTHLRDALPWWHVVYQELASDAPCPAPEDRDFLDQALACLPALPWDEQTWPTWMRTLGSTSGRKGRALFHPLRLALTGAEQGPSMQALLPLLGYDRVVERIRNRATVSF